MTRFGFLMGLAAALVALPGRVEGQRSEPSTTRSDLVQQDITCDVRIFTKNPDGTTSQWVDNASWVWSAPTPPRAYAVIIVRNSGRVGVSVQSTVQAFLPDKTPSGGGVAQAYFVNAVGQNIALVLTPVVTVPANGMANLGPYWLKNEQSTVRYYVTANTDSNQHINEINETNNSCSRTFTIIAPPR